MKARTPVLGAFAVGIALVTSSAWAQQTPSDDGGAGAGRESNVDPTGGAYTSPTLLVTPAAALPSMSVRVTTGVDAQSPAGAFANIRPYAAGEVGLGRGFTVAGGSRWYGGGDGRSTAEGLNPFAQVRYQLFGRSDGMGLTGGVSATYKQFGFRNAEREVESAFALQYRTPHWDFGGQAVFGQSLKDGGEHDVEGRGYATYRVLPQLAMGIAGQGRADVGEEEANAPVTKPRRYDVIGGGIASLTLGVWQVGTLVGATTVGLGEPKVGGVGQLFASVRF